MPLDEGTAALLKMIEDAGYPAMHEGTPETARQALRAMTVDWVTPETQVPVASVDAVDAGGVPARVYRPEGSGPRPTLVYLHGGGFVIGDLDTHDQTCRRFCRDADVVVVSVDYRLAPEAPFPAAVDDALTAVAWASEHDADLGGAGRLAVAGDSAGGNLAAVAAQTLRDQVHAQVLIYPATHMSGDYPSRTENAEGYFLDVPRCCGSGATTSATPPTSTTRGTRRCWATWTASRRPSSSPPSTTRCATRARCSPTVSSRPVCPSTGCATTASCTGSST